MLGWRVVLVYFHVHLKAPMGAVTAVRAMWLGRSLERRELGHIVATPSARGWMFGTCQLSCRTSWWAGYRWFDLAVGGGIGSLERWAFRKVTVQHKNVVMQKCAAIPHGLGAGHSSGHPGQGCASAECLQGLSLLPQDMGRGLRLHNKTHPTCLGIISVSSQSLTKLRWL